MSKNSYWVSFTEYYMLNMDLKFLWAPCAQLYSLDVTFGLIYEGAIGQPRCGDRVGVHSLNF